MKKVKSLLLLAAAIGVVVGTAICLSNAKPQHYLLTVLAESPVGIMPVIQKEVSNPVRHKDGSLCFRDTEADKRICLKFAMYELDAIESK